MIQPSQVLENTIRIINQAMNYAGMRYWLCFGGLWGLVQNNGIVPDGDLDLCTYYGQDHERIVRSFMMGPGRYKASHIMTDESGSKALHIGFHSEAGFPHLCLSFWVLHRDKRYYCHDQHKDLNGTVPASGYYFRGLPAYAVEDNEDNFRLVEWPGINQTAQIRVPRFPGVVLDHLYPDWPYRKQRYEVKTGKINEEKMASYHKGGAYSPYSIHVNRLSDFNNDRLIDEELRKSKIEWQKKIKAVK